MSRISPAARLAATMTVCLLAAPSMVDAQPTTGPRFIDTGRVDENQAPRPKQQPEIAQPPAATASAPPGVDQQTFTLNGLRIVGVTSLPIADIDAIWMADRGKTVPVKRLYEIADQIGAAYARAGVALYTVSVPSQTFGTGPVTIQVVEGFVDSVLIDGDTSGDMTLVNAYAERVKSQKPLRQTALERELLLMNAVPGLEVSSQLEPVSPATGAVRLHLTVKRKRFEAGTGFNNQGANVLGRVQVNANVVANSLLRQGDRTQFVIGVPIEFRRYQYYGLTHIEPLGTDGATVSISVGELVTNPVYRQIGGSATFGSIQFSYPAILTVHERLTLTTSLDMLNSNNAILGTTLSDERTRVLRAGVFYAADDSTKAVNVLAATLSQGLDGLGGRRGNVAFGGPSFTKFGLRLAREQPIGEQFVLRAKASGQIAADHLPSSEQFAYGGLEYGQAFKTATLVGDSALAGALELAYRIPARWTPSWMTGNEAFIFGDGARVWNRNTIYQLKADSGASAGFGARTKFLDKLGIDLKLARAVQQPRLLGKAKGYVFVANITGTF